MSEEKFGIENLKKVLALGVGIQKWYKSANEDGKIELSEVFAGLPQLMAIPDLIASKDAIIQEAKDLSMDEVHELSAGMEGVASEKVVDIIIDALVFIVATKALIEDF